LFVFKGTFPRKVFEFIPLNGSLGPTKVRQPFFNF
jgi:hypothetical protein